MEKLLEQTHQTSHDKQLPLKAKRDRLQKEQTTLRTNEY